MHFIYGNLTLFLSDVTEHFCRTVFRHRNYHRRSLD